MPYTTQTYLTRLVNKEVNRRLISLILVVIVVEVKVNIVEVIIKGYR